MLRIDSILYDIIEVRNWQDTLGHLVDLCTEDSIVWYNILFSLLQCQDILKDLSPNKNILLPWSWKVNQIDGRLGYFSKHHLCPQSLLMHE